MDPLITSDLELFGAKGFKCSTKKADNSPLFKSKDILNMEYKRPLEYIVDVKSISESALLIFFQVHKWNGENLQKKNDAKKEMKMDALSWVTKKGFQSKYGILYRGRKHSIVFENSTSFAAKLCALLHGN
ncbi:hypothetical protein KQX54_015469 [Cotesia glomerata]|uniref:Uncharacterized protein n=1 Tax=Cotesia glomerata TaxID=32391 RepID=A0AAV7IVN7_COTGL|nr:hypothetical protein KQX54_015469 [Cotesia glomerata]